MRPRLLGLVVVIIGYLLSPLPAFAVETVSYLHQDHLGSTALVTDSSGNVVDQEVYYPYGSTRNQLLATGYPLTTRKYTGQVSDVPDTSLYYYNARYYSPTVGKFTQADTLEGPNRYAYVNANPLIYIDPSGEQTSIQKGDLCMPVPPWESTYMSIAEEPVDIAKERQRIERQYHILINPVDWVNPNSEFYIPPSPWYPGPVNRSPWTLTRLHNLETTLRTINPSVYQNTSLLLASAHVNSGNFLVKENMIVLQSYVLRNSPRFDYITVHEYAHAAQFDDNGYYSNFYHDVISLANEYGFYDIDSLPVPYWEYDIKAMRDYITRWEEEPLSISYQGWTDFHQLMTLPLFRHSKGTYALVNWEEFGAVTTTIVGGYLGKELQYYYQQKYPKLYDYIQSAIFTDQSQQIFDNPGKTHYFY